MKRVRIETERSRERKRRWAAANRKRVRANHRRWSAENREHVRESHRRRRALRGTRDQERERLRKGLPIPTRPVPATCELCSRPPGKKSLALDHCHASGAFRGWLCGRCNAALGLIGDTREALVEWNLNAARYLRQELT